MFKTPNTIYRNYILNLADIAREEEPTWLSVSIYLSEVRIESPFLFSLTRNRYFRSDCPPTFNREQIIPWDRKTPRSYGQLARNEHHYLFANNFSRRPFVVAKKKERDVGGVTSQRVCVNHANHVSRGESGCGKEGRESRGTFPRARGLWNNIITKSRPDCFSRDPLAAREEKWRAADRTAAEERLIKRAKTVFIKFICGNMRRLK